MLSPQRILPSRQNKRIGAGKRQSRQLLMEAMEERRVLTFGMAVDVAAPWELTPEWHANQVRFMHSGQVDATEVGNFQEESEAQAALESLAIDYWEELFGEELDRASKGHYPFLALDGSRPNTLRAETFSLTSSDSHSHDLTNVRIPGIDEADTAEFIGENQILVANDGLAQIFDISDPEQIEFLSSFKLEGYGHRFLSSGDTLFVLSGATSPFLSIASLSIFPGGFAPPMTTVSAYDLSDPSSPSLLDTFELEGSMNSAHVVGTQLVVGTQSRAKIPELEIVAIEGVEDAYRFETEEEYLARVSNQLIESFLPDLSQISPEGETRQTTDMGDFSDLHILADGGRLQQLSLWTFEASSEGVRFVDGESIVGPEFDFAYVDSDSVYAVDNDNQAGEAEILAFAFDDEQVAMEASGTVPGIIRSSYSMDEYQDTLRVFTTGEITALRGNPEANLFMLQVAEGELEVVGELLDLAPGESQLGTVFDGEFVYTTTGDIEVVEAEFRIGDPLHIIDVSNPEEPFEISELDIPGLANTLRRVDENHLLGIGWNADDGRLRRQLTLYNVSDAENPTIVQNWLSGEAIRARRFTLQRIMNGDEMDVRYDAATGILVADGGPFSRATEAYRITPDNAEAAIQFLGHLESPGWQTRTFVTGGQLVSHSGDKLAIYDIEDLELLGSQNIGNPLRIDSLVLDPQTQEIAPLENDDVPEGAVITAVISNLGNEHTISEDGQTILLNREHVSEFGFEHLEYEVRLPNGQVFSSYINLNFMRVTEPQREYSDAVVAIELQATDDAGNPIEEVSVGDTFWVTISADREGFNDNGVFAAYFDVLFDTSVLNVVSQEALGTYTNGVRGENTERGIELLGGFTGETQGTAGPNEIVRIQLEVIAEGPLAIVAKASESTNAVNEILTYGDNDPVDPKNVREGILELRGKQFEDTDVNQDGVTTAVDALILTNQLNRRGADAAASAAAEGEFTMKQMDVNGDDQISAVDILMIINKLNEGNSRGLRGEGEASPSDEFFADSIFDASENDPFTMAIDLDGFNEEGRLAGAHSAIWDIERRR